MGSLDSETANKFGFQEENIKISKPQGKTTNYEKKHRKRERETAGQKMRGGREDAVLSEKGG